MTRLVVSVLLVGSYFFLPKYGFTSFNSPLIDHLLYPLSHANIFHLAANVLCLWLLKCPTYLYITYPIAVIASFLPSFTIYTLLGYEASGVTMGFSGVLFAIAAMAWGKIHRFKRMFTKNIWYVVIPFFVPNINAILHVYCMLMGYYCGQLTTDYKLRTA